MAIELRHQRLTETHHFAFALAFRIEIAAAFTAAHRQRGQRIFKRLLEAEEFQDREVNGRMKTHPALIRADGGIKLYAPGTVNLHLITIVHPHHAELDHAFWLNQTFQQ